MNNSETIIDKIQEVKYEIELKIFQYSKTEDDVLLPLQPPIVNIDETFYPKPKPFQRKVTEISI